MPGKGTRKGGTMTGGKAGMAAGWPTPCGRAAGSSGTVCTAVTGHGSADAVTAATAEVTEELAAMTAAGGARSATMLAAAEEAGGESCVTAGSLDPP